MESTGTLLPVSIETAVPLVNTTLDKDEGKDDAIAASSNFNSAETSVRIATDSHFHSLPMWFFFLSGIFIGVVVSGATFTCVEKMIDAFGTKPEFQRFSEYVLFCCLWVGIHLGYACSFLLFMGIACILTPAGSRRVSQMLQSTSDGTHVEEEATSTTTREIFLAAVYFDVGFFVGTDIMGLLVEYSMGLPLSLGRFTGSLILEVVLCCGLVKCYDYRVPAMPQVEENECTTALMV